VDEAQFEIENAKIELAVLIFTDYNTPYTIVDDLQIPPLLPAAIADVRTQAVENSPELRAAMSAVQLQNLGVGAAKSEFMPSFTIQYNYGLDANRFAPRSNGIPNLGSSVLGTLNIPIFNWGATRSRIRQAEARQKQAELDLNRTQKELSSNVQLLYREAEFARSQADSLQASLDLAAETVRLTLLAYSAGEASVLEVIDAQRSLTEARNAVDDGLARYRAAWANIQVIIGAF
jgi:outer membrane protein TolC